MTSDEKVFGIGDGRLHLKAFANDDVQADPAPFLTGGVTSQGKYSFTYGKIVIRARFQSARGAWPALWLLGEQGGWPSNGEIDLMEHLNFDESVYQSVHSTYTQQGGKSPTRFTQTPIQRDEFNTYGVEWDESKLTFTVNGSETLEYPRVPEKGEAQWPFKHPFYIIMSMQVGGDWVGPADPQDYPAGMEIDWVRVYEKEPAADR
ncbi:MAG: glycoside hydrolase family 16 protein [Novipirellula sp. JB048]